MLRKSLNFIYINKTPLTNTLKAPLSTTTIFQEKWDLLTAVCLERKPIITPELDDMQKEYLQLLNQVELEKSLKSDHEIRHEDEMRQLEALKKGDEELDVALKQTAQDIVDAAVEELSQFKHGSKTTEADKKNDVRSLDRKLDKHLVLVVNQKIGDKKYYLLPQGKHEDGETLRQTADRVLAQSIGKDVKAQIYGNGPSGFYKYKYPKDARSEVIGAKVFIYFARHLEGQLPEKGIDYKWLDRRELNTALPPAYRESVNQMLIEE